MSSKNSSSKTVSVAQGESENERGAVRDAERMRAYDAVESPYPSVERKVEFDTSVEGVAGGDIGRREAEQHCLDRGSAPDVNGSWVDEGQGEFGNKTLYQQECIEAREAELEIISKRAGANPEHYPRAAEKRAREEETMALHQKRMEECRNEVEAEARKGIVARGYVDDPREHIETEDDAPDRETIGELNQQAERVADRYDQSRAVIGKRIAEKIVEGTAVPEAVMSLVEELCDERTVRTPISMVESTDSWATIEGVVAKLFEPASSNQQQAGIIEDESGSAKVTVWANSRMDTVLSEGDVVRIQDAKPGLYNEQLTLAVVSDTRMIIKEKGGGRSPMGGHDIPEPNPHVGAIKENEDDDSVEEDHAEVANECSTDDDEDEYENETEDVNVERSRERTGVSWGSKKRREAEKKGRRQRLNERKYNVPEWRRTTSVITAYRHQDLSLFGADERMVGLDLPPLRNGQ